MQVAATVVCENFCYVSAAPRLLQPTDSLQMKGLRLMDRVTSCGSSTVLLMWLTKSALTSQIECNLICQVPVCAEESINSIASTDVNAVLIPSCGTGFSSWTRKTRAIFLWLLRIAGSSSTLCQTDSCAEDIRFIIYVYIATWSILVQIQ